MWNLNLIKISNTKNSNYMYSPEKSVFNFKYKLKVIKYDKSFKKKIMNTNHEILNNSNNLLKLNLFKPFNIKLIKNNLIKYNYVNNITTTYQKKNLSNHLKLSNLFAQYWNYSINKWSAVSEKYKHHIVLQIISKKNQQLNYIYKNFYKNNNQKIYFQATHGLLSKYFGQKKKSFKRSQKLILLSVQFFYKYWLLKFNDEIFDDKTHQLVIQIKKTSQLSLYALKIIESTFIKNLKNKIDIIIITRSNSFNRSVIKKIARIKRRLKKKLIKKSLKFSQLVNIKTY